MRRVAAVGAATAALALATVGAAGSVATTGYHVSAKLAPPAGGASSRARGSFSGALKNGKLLWTLLYSDLSGPPTFTRIELGPSGKGGGGAVRLCIRCRNARSGSASIGPALLAAILHHRAYVTVHTTKYPAGELRGRLVPVP